LERALIKTPSKVEILDGVGGTSNFVTKSLCRHFIVEKGGRRDTLTFAAGKIDQTAFWAPNIKNEVIFDERRDSYGINL
jgi:hypothetical protein